VSAVVQAVSISSREGARKALEKSFFLAIILKITLKMEEGTVPVPTPRIPAGFFSHNTTVGGMLCLPAPALIAMLTYYLSGGYRIRGSHSGGGETPVSVQILLSISTEPHKILCIIDANFTV